MPLHDVKFAVWSALCVLLRRLRPFSLSETNNTQQYVTHCLPPFFENLSNFTTAYQPTPPFGKSHHKPQTISYTFFKYGVYKALYSLISLD